MLNHGEQWLRRSGSGSSGRSGREWRQASAGVWQHIGRLGITRLDEPGGGDGMTVALAESGTLSERRMWDEAAGGLTAWWSAFESFMAPVSEAMISEAAVATGASVADIATGFGEPALSLARLVGPTGRVAATDLSPGMLAVAVRRARLMGLDNVDFTEMDADRPNMAQAGFDAVVCRLGLMFVSDVHLCVRRLTDLLAPGGRLVAAVWGPAGANPSITVAAGALNDALGRPSTASDTSGIFGLGGHGVLSETFAAAGLQGVRSRAIDLELTWPTAQDYVEYHQQGPVGRLMGDVDPGTRTAAWEAVAAAAIRRCDDGPLRLPAQVIVVSGRSPRCPSARQSDVLAPALNPLTPVAKKTLYFSSSCRGGSKGLGQSPPLLPTPIHPSAGSSWRYSISSSYSALGSTASACDVRST